MKNVQQKHGINSVLLPHVSNNFAACIPCFCSMDSVFLPYAKATTIAVQVLVQVEL